MNIVLFLGGLLGLSSIMMAAFVDHALMLHLSEKVLASVLTAVRYHQLYAIVISMIGLFLPLQINSLSKLWLRRTAFLFIVGVTLFSFSIYSFAIFNLPWIIHVTPFGGMILMLAWLSLIRTSLLKNKVTKISS
jgi:uncharacterized membrane protein YgdD (TMEM256/DUF423 family)